MPIFPTSILFQRLAIAVGLEGSDGQKLGESIWKIVIYSITWLWAAHLLF